MRKLSGIESLFYNLMCISTFGIVWMNKVVMKKAYLDALNSKESNRD